MTTSCPPSPAGDSDPWDACFYKQVLQRAMVLLRNHRSNDLLEPEDLVHDAYLRLAAGRVGLYANDAEHYFAIATRIMRRSLIDRRRAAGTMKRFGQLKRLPLNPDLAPSNECQEKSLWVNDLVEHCSAQCARRSLVARLHFLEARTSEEIGGILRISSRTVKRDLRAVRHHLRSQLKSAA